MKRLETELTDYMQGTSYLDQDMRNNLRYVIRDSIAQVIGEKEQKVRSPPPANAGRYTSRNGSSQ